MVNKKCEKCKKNVTKKLPGLECSRCSKIIHADPECSKLSNKQLNTLRNSPAIEWSCGDCLKNISRRSSFIIPDDDDDNDESESGSNANTQIINAKKLAKDISREVQKTFREEIGNLGNSLEFLSEQIVTLEQSLRQQNNKIKDLENKNLDLINKNKNMELRITILEQNYKDIEQKSLASSLEIAGLPDIQSNELKNVIQSVASKLNLNEADVQSSQRLPGSKDKPGTVLIELKTKVLQQKWIEAGKKKSPTIGMLVPGIPEDKAEDRVYLREALTKHQKTLLYHAKSRLLNSCCQYVWCKNGKICARKTGTSKIHYIRSTFDINKIEKLYSEQSTKNSKISTPL